LRAAEGEEGSKEVAAALVPNIARPSGQVFGVHSSFLSFIYFARVTVMRCDDEAPLLRNFTPACWLRHRCIFAGNSLYH
jgi:hypothetical protein